MVTPINSPIHAPKPEGGGGSDPSPGGGAADPTLEMLWKNGYVPGFGGAAPGSGGGSSGGDPAGAAPPPPGHAAFTVDLATLYTAVSAGATEASHVVDAYNALKTRVDAVVASGTFWGQQATNFRAWYDNSGIAGGVGPIRREGDFPDHGVQQAAAQFAPVINPELTTALRSVADAVELYGVYLARLDQAGQAYAAADYGSILPEVAPRPKS
ncbi:hypothetical protein ACFCX4_25020 [Kitasatospora sp. NPDC056327]|uniref:hypothetical protein n=1 Tax=Kitasatospora sp. NPDC056327 TaxID=3345785 RepID=UPI0035D90B15